MPIFEKNDTQEFTTPTALPETLEQAHKWQKANQSWWESYPMRYDWKEEVGFDEFTKEFYVEIDKRFFSDAKVYMPWKKIPFDTLIDFNSLQNNDVLEIGVGNGSHAGLLAQYARSYTGIDITDYAVKSTLERMRCYQLQATILQMDAECMEFGKNSFDFIWSWGVIHHSSDTRRVLSEMYRVLRPGGQAITMVYYRNFWNWYVHYGLFIGIFRGILFRTRSVHRIVQEWTDGAIARYYSIPEWRKLASEFFCVENISVFGGKSNLVLLPSGKAKNVVMSLIPNELSRLLTNRCKMGSLLVSTLKKPC